MSAVAVACWVICLSLSTVHAKSVIAFAALGSPSHQSAFGRIGLELTERGHSFSLLVSKHDSLSQSRLSKDPFRDLDVIYFDGPVGIGTEGWAQENGLRDGLRKVLARMRAQGLLIARSLLEDHNAIQAMRAANFDLAISDIISWPTYLLAEILGIPQVDVLTHGVIHPVFGPRYSIPNPIAYVPQLPSGLLPNTGFGQRLDNVIKFLFARILVMSDPSKPERELSQRYGYTADRAWLRRSSAAAVIVAGDWALEYPMPIPPKVHMVGPLMTMPAKPLGAELAAFPDGSIPAQDSGAVFVALGTAVRLVAAEATGMAANLAALQRPVLWKISDAELPGNMTVASLNLPAHVRAIKWAPQNDVLGHPSTKAFVTHAGANSLYEAAYHAVPVVAIPFQSDQTQNAAKSVYHGFGIKLSIKDLNPESTRLAQAVDTVIQDARYQVNATKVQKRLQKPRTPPQQAVDVIEHVLATDAEDYLETSQHLYSWWQLALLDVHAFLMACAALVIGLIAGIIWLVRTMLKNLSFSRLKKSL